MRNRKLGLLLLIVMGAIIFSACGKESAKENNPADKPETQKEDLATNKKNVEAVVKAVKDPNVRYKLAINYEGDVYAISTTIDRDKKTYGFDNPKTGTSVYAYASQKGLNEEQESAIESLLSSFAVDENGKELSEVGEYFPGDFYKGRYPYQGADYDYLTLSNIETVPSKKGENYTKITADVNVHLHLVDGTEKTRTFKSSTVPEVGDTPLKEGLVKGALSAEVMNEDFPTEDRFIYPEKPE